MPLKNEDIPALTLRWAAGNEPAAAFLQNIMALTRLADDIADGDSADPVGHMGEILVRALVNNAENPFFRDNARALSGAMMLAIMSWVRSEDMRKSENRKTRMFGFVGREAIEQVTILTATLCGGYHHGLAVMADLHTLAHQTSPETFEEWEQE